MRFDIQYINQHKIKLWGLIYVLLTTSQCPLRYIDMLESSPVATRGMVYRI